jgi:hypothetical protein
MNTTSRMAIGAPVPPESEASTRRPVAGALPGEGGRTWLRSQPELIRSASAAPIVHAVTGKLTHRTIGAFGEAVKPSLKSRLASVRVTR